MDEPRIINVDQGSTIFYKNKYLYSKKVPLKIERVISNLDLKDKTIYLYPSPLFFYGHNQLLENIPDSSIIISIEADPILFSISNKDFILAHINSGLDFIELLKNIDMEKYRYCELLQLTGGYNLYKEIYDGYYNVLLSSLHNFWKNKVTTIRLGQLWNKNFIKNLKNIHDSQPLESLKIDKDVIVVGAGESLESSLEFLSSNQDLIYILCVDTALQALLDYNIIPNGVIALESQFYNLMDFYGSKNITFDIIYDLSSYPNVTRVPYGNKYYFITEFTKNKLISQVKKIAKNSIIPPLGSVGITAIYLALKITNKNIFLTGLDFSYVLGKSHSRGTPYNILNLLNTTRVKSIYNIKDFLKRPLLIKKNKKNSLELTDSILFEYSIGAKNLLFGTQRVFDLTQRGMDLGIPQNSNIKKYREDHSNIEFTNINFDNLYSSIVSTIDQSIINLKASKQNNNNIEETMTILKDIDYLFSHYPTSAPINNLTINNIDLYLGTLIRYKRQLGLN